MPLFHYKTHPYALYVLFLILAIFWSASFIAIKISIAFFSPVFAAMLRVGVAFAALSILFLFTKTPLRLPLKTAALLWFQGIIAQGMAFVFLFWGEQYIAPALASIINATVPLWVLLINGVILREKKTFTFKKTFGLILGFMGIVTIFTPMLLSDSTPTGTMALIGTISVSGMAIFYAIGAVLYQKLFAQTEINFKASIWHQHIGSFVFLFFFSLCANTWPQTHFLSSFSDAFFAIVYLGLFSTAFAWLIYSHLIVQWGAVRAVSVVYVVPLFAIIWDILFLHIPVHYYELVGMATILIGVLFVQTPQKKQNVTTL